MSASPTTRVTSATPATSRPADFLNGHPVLGFHVHNNGLRLPGIGSLHMVERVDLALHGAAAVIGSHEVRFTSDERAKAEYRDLEGLGLNASLFRAVTVAPGVKPPSRGDWTTQHPTRVDLLIETPVVTFAPTKQIHHRKAIAVGEPEQAPAPKTAGQPRACLTLCNLGVVVESTLGAFVVPFENVAQVILSEPPQGGVEVAKARLFRKPDNTSKQPAYFDTAAERVMFPIHPAKRMVLVEQGLCIQTPDGAWGLVPHSAYSALVLAEPHGFGEQGRAVERIEFPGPVGVSFGPKTYMARITSTDTQIESAPLGGYFLRFRGSDGKHVDGFLSPGVACRGLFKGADARSVTAGVAA